MQFRGMAGDTPSTCVTLILVGLLAVGSLSFAGCSGSTPSINITGPDSKNDRDKNKGNGRKTTGGPTIKDTVPDLFPDDDVGPKKAMPIPDAPPEALYEPTVLMSAAHAKTCLVRVGDALPAMTLPDLEGNDQTLSKFYGEKLTVVVFWDIGHVYAEEQFMRLERETTSQFSKFGVSVVAINVGNAPAEVQSAAERAKSQSACLLDQDGTAFGVVATGRIPRTYVLDAEGKVLWLDIEYSRSTERELRNAIYYFLRDGEDG